MKKKLFAFVIILTILVSSVPVLAEPNEDCPFAVVSASANEKIIYEDTLVVSSEGGTFKVGFASVTFKKNFIDEAEWPIEIEVSIYAEDGTAYIEFTPEIGEFNKKVKVKIKNAKGYLYDISAGENVWFDLKNQVLQLSHFSRYAFS